MRNLRHSLSSAFALLACAGGLFASTAHADEHVLVILDATGSMSAMSVPGKTRMQVAKERIAAFLSAVPGTPTKYAFWTFTDSSYTPVFTFAQNKQPQDIINALPSINPGGVTPLAFTVCAAVDELIAYLPNQNHVKRIIMATDGEENNTAVGSQCYGPSSSKSYDDGLDVNSWQWKVRNKACTGVASSPGPCTGTLPPPLGLTFIINVAHLFDFITFQSVSSSYGLEGDDSLSFTSSLAPNADALFFQGLAKDTKGSYVGITPSTPPAQASPIPGDGNRDGCVNAYDRSLVLSQYGQTVPAGTSSDFNYNGVVDQGDYQTVLNNFGKGCAAP